MITIRQKSCGICEAPGVVGEFLNVELCQACTKVIDDNKVNLSVVLRDWFIRQVRQLLSPRIVDPQTPKLTHEDMK